MKEKILIGILLFLAIILIIIGIGLIWYKAQLEPVNTEIAEEKTIEIEAGMSTEDILTLLYENGLIKNVFASEIYIKLNNVESLKAGKYELNSAMSLYAVLNQIASGEVIDEQVTITFLEGKNMTDIAQTIAENTNNTQEDVYSILEDEEYIQNLIDQYWFLTDEILDEDIYYPLEGYLYPETYTFEDENVTVEDIFTRMLNQMDTVLTQYATQISQSKYSVHEILTIASIIELEGKDETARAGIASVIYNRLEKEMNIGSDVTTYYAIQVDVSERDLYTDEINTYNAYNTRGPDMEGKLPIGPIANISEESLNASLNPEDTEYLYFVSDINGEIYFSSTYEEHEEKIEELQKQGLWYEYDSEEETDTEEE